MRLRHAAPGRAVIFSQRTRVRMPEKYRTCRFLTGCSLSPLCSSRPSGGVAGKKRRTVLRAIQETRGINVETPECRSDNQAVIDYFVWRVQGMQAVSSGWNRQSTACEYIIPSKQTAN